MVIALSLLYSTLVLEVYCSDSFPGPTLLMVFFIQASGEEADVRELSMLLRIAVTTADGPLTGYRMEISDSPFLHEKVWKVMPAIVSSAPRFTVTAVVRLRTLPPRVRFFCL